VTSWATGNDPVAADDLSVPALARQTKLPNDTSLEGSRPNSASPLLTRRDSAARVGLRLLETTGSKIQQIARTRGAGAPEPSSKDELASMTATSP
jgi:hypothetical protein